MIDAVQLKAGMYLVVIKTTKNDMRETECNRRQAEVLTGRPRLLEAVSVPARAVFGTRSPELSSHEENRGRAGEIYYARMDRESSEKRFYLRVRKRLDALKSVFWRVVVVQAGVEIS